MVSLSLNRPVGTVQVTHDAASAVAVAALSADNVSFGNIARGQTMTISLQPGQHTVQLSAEGRTTQAPVNVRQGQTISLTIGLRPVNGALRITHDAASAFPNATLFLDNANRGMLARGNSIVIENLPPRTYAVRLSQRNRDANANVTVVAGATAEATLRIDRPVGTVQVTHDAASAVAVAALSADGVSFGNINRGQTMSISLEPGRHTVQLSAEGRTTEAPVNVQPGRTISLTIGLRPVHGTLRVTHAGGSAFATATLYVNDQQRGTIRRGQALNLADIPAGTHTVRLDQEGQSSSATVSVVAGQTASVSLSLTRPVLTGTITVIYEQGRAADAQIFVNGVRKGVVRRGQSLNIGSYPANTQVVVQVRHGNQTQNVTVNVQPDSQLPAGTNRLVLRLN
jgi:phosphatidate phosphatase APP1